MNINYIYKKTYKNGLYDYTDADGNIIDYDNDEYSREERYYIDTTPEEREKDRLKSEETRQWYDGLVKSRAQMFVVNNGAPGNHPARLLRAPLLNPDSYREEGSFRPRQPLWGKYWAERELCIVAGDTGVGKTVLALHVAKALAGGCVLGVDDNVGRPRKVLYVDFELDQEGFYLRYGNDDTLEHLYWAGYNQKGRMPGKFENACEWMLDSINACIKEHGIEAVIIDQPDRLRLAPKQWQDFLFAVKGMIAEFGIAVMLVVNTKPRNYNRPMELSHIYNHRDMCFAADSIVGIGADYKNGALRFIKVFKNKNRQLWRNEGLEGFIVDRVEGMRADNGEYSTQPLPHADGVSTPPYSARQFVNTNLVVQGESDNHPAFQAPLLKKEGTFSSRNSGFILQIFLTAAMDEEVYLKPCKLKIREQKMIAAESMRKDGMFIDDIAIELDVPEGTVKRWVAGIGRGEREKLTANHPLLDTNVALPKPKPLQLQEEQEDFDFYAKPAGLTDEEWAVCVNNPDSANYDEFAFNPYLVEGERDKGGVGHKAGQTALGIVAAAGA